MAEKNGYNVQEDEETGILYDCRNTLDLTYKLEVYEHANQQVGLITKGTYTYGLNKDIIKNPPTDNYGLGYHFYYENAKNAVKGGVLLDHEGYPLFSKTLLNDYGIGFILSDWLIKDTDGKIKVEFSPKYLWAWYSDDSGVFIIIMKSFFLCNARDRHRRAGFPVDLK